MKARFTLGIAVTLSLLLVTNPLVVLAVGKNNAPLPSDGRSKKEPEVIKSLPVASNRGRVIPRFSQIETPALAAGQTATLLPNGRWLLLGGEAEGSPVSAAAIKDARTGETSTLPDGLKQPRAWHTATSLPDGTVLIYGGIGSGGQTLYSAELFNPETMRFEALPSLRLTARAYHTATLLMNGQVLIAGGRGGNGKAAGKIEIWDSKTKSVLQLQGGMLAARSKHTATLLPDGNVYFSGGVNEEDVKVESGEVFGTESQTFNLVGSIGALEDSTSPYLMASAPKDGDVSVTVDSYIALRFSKPLRVETVNSEKLILNSSTGAVPVKVVPAERGMLAFVTPREPLQKGVTYTLTVSGSADLGNLPVTPTSITFTTESDPSGNNTTGTTDDSMSGMMPGHDQMRPSDEALLANRNRPPDPEEWNPGADNFKGNWETREKESPLQKMQALQASPGETALSGQVLTLKGEALANVTIHVGNRMAKTDSTGRFLLRGVGAGRQPFNINGSTASTPTKPYGTYEGLVNIKAGQTNVLPYTVWLPIIETRYLTQIPAPTTREIVATTPLIPGLEIHVPAGVHIKYPNGDLFKNLTITPIPANRTPLPLPDGVTPRLLFSLQMHGATTQRADGKKAPGLRIVYPNYGGIPAGTHVPLWDYDAAKGGWYIYGEGTVTKDGRQIMPDPGVELPGMHCYGGFFDAIGPLLSPAPGSCAVGGDPVDLGTGLFMYSNTDVVLPDTLPIALTRTYRPMDYAAHAFGVGTNHPFEMTLSGDNANESWAELVLPDGGRIRYDRTNPGANPMTFEHTATPTAFYKSTLVYVQDGRGPDGNGWDLKLSDGTVYQFFTKNRGLWIHSADVKLQAIIDRYGNKLSISRDQLLRITRVTSPNRRWLDFTYDTDPNYTYRVTQITDNMGRTVGYTYDGSNRLWKVTDAKGGVTEYGYDGSSLMLTIKDPSGIVFLTNEYDANGKVSKQTRPDNSSYQFAYTLDANGQVTQTDLTDPRGNTSRITFNSAGQPVSKTFAVGKPEQQIFTYERQATSNFLLKTIDPLGRKTAFTYNAAGKVMSITRMAETAEANTVSMTYEPGFNRLSSITDPLNHTTSYAYDSKGNLTSVTNALNQQATYTYNAAGQLETATDAMTNTSRLIYEAGDVVEVRDPLGRALKRFVDGGGRIVSLTNPVGQTLRFEYDNLNQLTRTVDPLQGATISAYNANGYLESIKDARNNITSYVYNNMNRVETRRDPLMRDSAYLYDANGNMRQVTDRKGQVTTITYDALNRLKQITYADQSTTSYTYDAANRLTQIVDSISGTITYGYDNLDRLTSETTPQGTVSYTYDAVGRRATMTVAGQPTVNYTYDNANRLTGITQGAATVTIAYDAAGRRESMTLPNGVTTEYGYDAGSQLTSLTYKKDATVLGSLTYEYDQLGRRTKVGGSFARSILPQSLSAAVYNAANQQTSFSGQTLTYDLNGNLTSDGTNSYTWDARDRLVSITGPGVSAGFQYDALGRRSSKAINGSTASYLYDGLNMVQEQAGGASVNLLSGGVDEVFTRTDLGGTHGLLLDGQGSTLASTDAAGAFESEYTYDPFGTTTYSGAPSTNAQQYTGRENDATGLYYYRARYYSPRLQRFISQDPIGFGGGVNHYAYAANNPIKWSDPDGTKIIGVSVGGSAWGGTYYGGGGSGGTLYGYNTADGTLGTASSYGYFYPQPKSTDCAGPKQMVMPWPNTPSSDGKGYAFGGGAGIGLSGVLSNADNWDDLHGDFDTYLVGLGSVSFEFDLGQNNSGQTIWAFQASPKTGLGASLGFAHFKTTTPPDSIGTLQGLGSNLAADISKLYGGCYTGCR